MVLIIETTCNMHSVKLGKASTSDEKTQDT